MDFLEIMENILGSFSMEKQLKLLQGGTLTHEISVVLNRHLK